MKLVSCSKCDKGVAEYHKHRNSYHCNSCDNSAPNSLGGSVEAAAKVWNDCNTPTRTMADVMAENEELKADILKTVIQSGEVLKHHTSLIAHIERLHYVMCELLNVEDKGVEEVKKCREALKATPVQSLDRLEAGAVRKVASILCGTGTGKNLVSHTALMKYADNLEKQV